MNRYDALRHAVKAHAGQVDKCGQPYVLHPIAVAEAVAGFETLNTTNYEVVALLHDVAEDTDYSLNGIGLTTAQASGLVYLTHIPIESYAQYIDAICQSESEIPMAVKLADLWHNLSPERQDCLPESERKGLEKRYLKARDRIWEALGYEWWPSGSKGETQ